MVGPTIYLVGLETLSLDHDVAQAAAGGGRGRDGVVVVAGGHGGHHLEGWDALIWQLGSYLYR